MSRPAGIRRWMSTCESMKALFLLRGASAGWAMQQEAF